MATAKFRGWLWCNDGTSGDPTGYFFTPGGVHGSAANETVVSNVYLWRGNIDWCVQFNITVNARNTNQGGWSTFDSSSSGARGSRGLAFGVFVITLGGTNYLFMPQRVFGYFDGGSLVKVWINCSSPLVS